MPELVTRTDTGHVARLVLNSPESFNTLSEDMIDALAESFRALESDSNIRAVILAATGKAFSAGHDLRQMQASRQQDDAGRAGFDRIFTRCAGMMQMIPALPQPVIAEIQGVAVAAGCQLVASCDLAIAAEGVRFGVNGINIGLFCSTPMVALTRAIPAKPAFEMLATGELISAERAYELGLINRVVPASRLTSVTMEMAKAIASKLPSAMAMGKRAFYEQLRLDLAGAYERTGAVMSQNMMLPDTDEGITAFLEKRTPRWP